MDSIFLTGPLGTQFNIGSWLEKDAGVDYGGRQLQRQQLTQTTFVDGAQLAYETAAGPRKMTFPLIVPSGGVAGLSLDTIEACLRQMVRPGGYVDMQPANVPTAEMVRFDILGGDVAESQYSVDLRRVSRARYALSLETQPFGYWPTWITLASVASVAAAPMVTAVISAASVIGDVPAFTRLIMTQGTPSPITTASANLDFMAWSLAGAPSAALVFPAGSCFHSPFGVNLVGDPSASWIGGPSAEALHATSALSMSLAAGGAIQFALGVGVIPPRGRFRGFGVFRIAGGGIGAVAAMLSVSDSLLLGAAAPTGNPIATVSAVASLAGASYYGLYDLGEVQIPNDVVASGYASYPGCLNLWMQGGVTGPAVTFDCAGLMLLPVGGPAGIMPRGLAWPSTNEVVNLSNLMLDSSINMVGLRAASSVAGLDVGAEAQQITARGFYRGEAPYVGGTSRKLVIMPFERYLGFGGTTVLTDGGPPVRVNTSFVSYSLSYRPRFAFAKGF